MYSHHKLSMILEQQPHLLSAIAHVFTNSLHVHAAAYYVSGQRTAAAAAVDSTSIVYSDKQDYATAFTRNDRVSLQQPRNSINTGIFNTATDTSTATGIVRTSSSRRSSSSLLQTNNRLSGDFALFNKQQQQQHQQQSHFTQPSAVTGMEPVRYKNPLQFHNC
jgi:hypothetical protein